MKKSPFKLFVLISILLMTACSTTTSSPDSGYANLPTPRVPSMAEIDSAMQRWENSHGSDYFIEVVERTQEVNKKVRVVVKDNQVLAAQVLNKENGGEWSEPQSLPIQEAQAYTVKGIFDRLRRDARGQGLSPINLDVNFNPNLGYPAVVDAEALPTVDDQGKVILNRQHSYDLSSEVKILLQDTFSPNREPILTLFRSGGPEARCDQLRVFEDGSSVYTDECQREVLHLTLPENRLEELNNLRDSFSSLEDFMQADDESQRLIIQGRGEGSPEESTLTAAWDLADTAYDLLSKPIGLGLTMVYTHNNRIMGFDTLNEVTQPTRIRPTGELFGASLSPDDEVIAFSDGEGLKYINIESGNVTIFLPPPDNGYFQPRGWSNTGFLFVTQISESDDQPIQHGWITIAQPSWHALPILQGSQGYGCDTGTDWSPDSNRLAITGRGYGEPCNFNAGLSIVDLSTQSAQQVVAPVIQTGEGEASTLIAGAYTPAWSPDGEWIAFGLDQDAIAPLTFPTRLYRSHPDGSDLTPLTNNSQGTAAYPVWTPDGVIYYGLSGVSVEADGIYQYKPTTNEHSLVINGIDLHPLSVSPDGEFLVYEQDGGLYLWGFIRQSATEVVPPPQDKPAKFVDWVSIADSGE